MPEVACYVYYATDLRLIERVERFGEFKDILPTGHSKFQRQVAFISWDGAFVEAVAVMTLGGPAVAFKRYVRFTDFHSCEPTSLEDVSAELPTRLAGRFDGAIADGGQVTPKTAEAVRRAVAQHFASLDHAWAEAENALRRKPNGLWPEQAEPVAAFERDATSLALRISGINPAPVMQSWDGDAQAPFLRGISRFRVLEDPAIANDAQVFGDWNRLRASVLGIAQFAEGDRKLTVLNVNRNPVERTLGCDLIYYGHEYESYVLVQYKRLRREGMTWAFRPSADKNFEAELARMRKLAPSGTGNAVAEPEQHRLGTNACFVKFCKPEIADPFSGELAPGMYVPLDLYDKLLAAGHLAGPKQGTVLSYQNAGRWLSNSLFVLLVEQAWVGTTGLSSAHIEEVVRSSLDAGRSLTLATDAVSK